MELIYLPKKRFNNMSFCKQSSSNVFIKSIHLHNSSRNIQSAITNVFPTSTETVRTKNFLPSYSSNKDTKNYSNELKITPSMTKRNKSFAFSKKKSESLSFLSLFFSFSSIFPKLLSSFSSSSSQ